MAKAKLPTNYKDDIMATSMGGLRRYRPIQNDDGTVSFEDVTDYTQVGSNFGAAQMNQTNTAVNNSADKSKIIDSLADVAANTQEGMMAGALAVRELNGNFKNLIYTQDVLKNAILIDVNNPLADINIKTHRLYIDEGSINMPPDCRVAIRLPVLRYDNNNIIVVMIETAPEHGRLWFNKYDKSNSKWMGWKRISPQ